MDGFDENNAEATAVARLVQEVNGNTANGNHEAARRRGRIYREVLEDIDIANRNRVYDLLIKALEAEHYTEAEACLFLYYCYHRGMVELTTEGHTIIATLPGGQPETFSTADATAKWLKEHGLCRDCPEDVTD